MFYVSSKKENLFGVTDTEDNVTEYYTKSDILKISQDVEIDGVDLAENMLCMVKMPAETVSLFKQGNIHLALSSMTLNNPYFGLRFQSKPTEGEMTFVNHQVLNISRTGVNSFSYDLGYSKSYRSGLTLDDIMMLFERFSNWSIEKCKLGRF